MIEWKKNTMIVRAAILLLTSLLAVVPSPVSPLVMRHNAEELKLSRFIFKVRLRLLIYMAEFEWEISKISEITLICC